MSIFLIFSPFSKIILKYFQTKKYLFRIFALICTSFPKFPKKITCTLLKKSSLNNVEFKKIFFLRFSLDRFVQAKLSKNKGFKKFMFIFPTKNVCGVIFLYNPINVQVLDSWNTLFHCYVMHCSGVKSSNIHCIQDLRVRHMCNCKRAQKPIQRNGPKTGGLVDTPFEDSKRTTK